MPHLLTAPHPDDFSFDWNSRLYDGEIDPFGRDEDIQDEEDEDIQDELTKPNKTK